MPYEPAWLLDMLCNERIADLPPNFEIGESSQAPPHAPLRDDPKNDLIPHFMTQGNQLSDRVGSLEGNMRSLGSTSLEQQVEKLEDEKEGGKIGHSDTMSAHYRALAYKTQMPKSRLDAAEH